MNVVSAGVAGDRLACFVADADDDGQIRRQLRREECDPNVHVRVVDGGDERGATVDAGVA